MPKRLFWNILSSYPKINSKHSHSLKNDKKKKMKIERNVKKLKLGNIEFKRNFRSEIEFKRPRTIKLNRNPKYSRKCVEKKTKKKRH